MGLHCTGQGVTVNRATVTMLGAGPQVEGTEKVHVRFSIVASAVVAALVGFGGTLAIIVEATRHLGATPAETASWITVLCLGMGVTSAWLSLRYRMPIITAWSLAGAVLVIASPAGTTMGHAIAAFMAAAVATVLCGVALREALRGVRVVLDAMQTGPAIRTYNIMMGERRRVAAALIAVP